MSSPKGAVARATTIFVPPEGETIPGWTAHGLPMLATFAKGVAPHVGRTWLLNGVVCRSCQWTPTSVGTYVIVTAEVTDLDAWQCILPKVDCINFQDDPFSDRECEL